LLNQLINDFKAEYKLNDVRLVKSPLRVCPLGAHIDHQHGLVTGIALNESIDMVYNPTDSGFIRIRSMDFPDEEYFHVDQVPAMIPGFWGNYVRGAVLSLRRNYKLRKGINAYISGKIPIGGLSSSAAVTTAYLLALCDVNEINLTKLELIEHSHWVETEFIGLKNGILDQAANILSEDKHLMVMDCSSGEYKLVPRSKNMPSFEVVVVYSGISKALIGTDYNNRVDECKVSSWLLKELAYDKVSSLKDTKLRDIDFSIYEKYKEFLPGRFKRRAEHFYSENNRVVQGVKAWEKGDIVTFGKLMFESGESSIYNYECGCPELITIYNILRECPGVYGARFSGAGYRGCCIGIINPVYKEEIKKQLDLKYPEKHVEYKKSYKVYFCQTDDGARLVGEV
jgi:galactokinase